MPTPWPSSRSGSPCALDLKKIHGLMRTPVLVDLRNIYVPDEAKAAGFTYIAVGRGDLEA